MTTERAIFAAGCFWKPESLFAERSGVVETAVGYIGGHTESPTYKEVCTGHTGHAEAIEVVYDPTKVTYSDLLDLFWGMHNPTQVNRQGWDIGTQYRSALFPTDSHQEDVARRSMERIAAKLRKPIATKLEAAGTFWRAEEYHQKYLSRR
ncbi:MAG: peptide-methionine (S)-S-oxide reductase MsrA [Alphaproteobacteria bacterium]|nr:peptide-methionine (S)-S-oxide reductase MsrA [Alphaproteobacteria bacterium]